MRADGICSTRPWRSCSSIRRRSTSKAPAVTRWGGAAIRRIIRPDLAQMVVGVVLDADGTPVCSEVWPGNTTDVKTLIPIVDRLKQTFHVERVCIVADRGMISRETIDAITDR